MIVAILPRLLVPSMTPEVEAQLSGEFIEDRQSDDPLRPQPFGLTGVAELKALKKYFDLDCKAHLTLLPPTSNPKQEPDFVSAQLEGARIHDWISNLDEDDNSPDRVTGLVFVGVVVEEVMSTYYPVVDPASLNSFPIPMIVVPHPAERRVRNNPNYCLGVKKVVRKWQRGLRA